MIYTPMRTWQDWERGKTRMHPGLWELFSLLVDDSRVATASANFRQRRSGKYKRAPVSGNSKAES